MILLATTSHPDILRHRHPNLGRLIQPRHYGGIAATAAAGIPWAADNDAFKAFGAHRYRLMLKKCRGLRGCLFVAAPDVVGDWEETLVLFETWYPELRGLTIGYVLQDGQPEALIPWDKIATVFVGGSTDFKIGAYAAGLVDSAKWRGKWVHMGRVNSVPRARYAASIGCDSIDGTKWSRFTSTWMGLGLDAARQPVQGRLLA